MLKPHIPDLKVCSFKSELKTADLASRTNRASGEDTVSEREIEDWGARFHTKDHYVEDRSLSGRPPGPDGEFLPLLANHRPQQKAHQLGKAWGYHNQPKGSQ